MRTIFTSSASTTSKPARNVRKGEQPRSQTNQSSKRSKKPDDLNLVRKKRFFKESWEDERCQIHGGSIRPGDFCLFNYKLAFSYILGEFRHTVCHKRHLPTPRNKSRREIGSHGWALFGERNIWVWISCCTSHTLPARIQSTYWKSTFAHRQVYPMGTRSNGGISLGQ